MGKVENAMEFGRRLFNTMGPSDYPAAIESRDRAIIDDVLDRVKEITLEVKGFADQSVRLAALRRELTGEGRGEVVATPTVKEAGDIMAAMARHRAQARDQVMGSTPLPEGAPPDDRTWFSPQGLAEHDKAVKVALARDIIADFTSLLTFVTDSLERSTIERRIQDVIGITVYRHKVDSADLAPAKVEYTPSDIRVVPCVKFKGPPDRRVIVCGDYYWDWWMDEWKPGDDKASGSVTQFKAEAVARALREAKMMPKGGGE